MTIILAKSCELGSDAAYHSFKLPWRRRPAGFVPYILHETSIGDGHTAFVADRIAVINMLTWVELLKEEASQRIGIAKALESRVHKTGISKVL